MCALQVDFGTARSLVCLPNGFVKASVVLLLLIFWFRCSGRLGWLWSWSFTWVKYLALFLSWKKGRFIVEYEATTPKPNKFHRKDVHVITVQNIEGTSFIKELA